MINLNQLRIFYYAAKHLSCTEAARHLFISQPAVTNQIRSFEHDWNLRLFRRKGNKIYLTEEAKTLYEYARQIFEYENKIEDVLKDLSELRLGTLCLGTTRTFARSLMPSLIAHYHKSYPLIKIKLNEGGSLDIIKNLFDFKDEVAIIVKLENIPDVHFIPFLKEEVVVIMPPGHPFAKKKALSLREIAQEPMIMKDAASGTRNVLDKLFARYKCTPRLLIETGDTEFIKQVVQNGEGISLLPRVTVSSELRENKLFTLPLKEDKIFLDIAIAYLESESLSLSTQKFLEVLRRMARSDKIFFKDIHEIHMRLRDAACPRSPMRK